MKVTIEVDSESEIEKLSVLLKTFKIDAVNIVPSDENLIPLIKGDKSINPESLFGIWASNPRSLDNIRKEGWQKN